MQTLSSAMRTAMPDSSAVECTTTLWMPISRQARTMRKAISPRLAIRIFLNMMVPLVGRGHVCPRMSLFDDQHRLAKFDRLCVFDQDVGDRAGFFGFDRVHDFHGFDDQQGGARFHFCAL